MVISNCAARTPTIFQTKNPIGQTLIVENKDSYKITGGISGHASHESVLIIDILWRSSKRSLSQKIQEWAGSIFGYVREVAAGANAKGA